MKTILWLLGAEALCCLLAALGVFPDLMFLLVIIIGTLLVYQFKHTQ